MQSDNTPEIILEKALEFKDPQDRAAYLDQACGGDAALHSEIDSLLAAHFDADAFMNTLAVPVWQETEGEKEGDRIGRYNLLQQIGEGGFGTVYLAEQTEPVKRRVALKVIKAGMDSKEVIARFEAERQALALMDHPHIAKVHDAGTTEGGRPYFVMELVKGLPLTKYCADKDLDTKARLELFMDVCAAVQHAHQKGIIHRDLKPSNILVSPHDGKPVVKVIDFGIAKAISMELTEKTIFTQLGRMIGTPQYMSPEQAELNALDVDTRSDIYSLGVVLYELLTGTTPLDGEQLRSAAYGEMQRLIREETPPKPSTRVSTAAPQVSINRPQDSRSLRGDLDWIVMKALEKDRNRRYETANALAQDIGRHLHDEPVTAGPPSAGYRLQKFVRRNRRGLLSSAAAALALMVGLAVAGWIWLDSTWEKRDRAVHARELIAQAEDHWKLNAAGDYEDDEHFLQARGLARQVEEALSGIDRPGEGVRERHSDLTAAIASEERDRALVASIQEALMRSVYSFGGESGAAADEIAAAFEEAGIHPLEDPLEDSVRNIMQRREVLRDWFLIGLVNWAEALRKTAPEKAERLEAVIANCDPDPWREKLLKAIESMDRAAIEALVDAPEFKQRPAMTILWLSWSWADPELAKASEKLLRRAHQSAPANFWTNFYLGANLLMAGAEVKVEGEWRKVMIGSSLDLGRDPGMAPVENALSPELGDAIGFLRAAAAARPDAGTAWMLLGTALSSVGYGADAIAAYEQAIKLVPNDASTLGMLGVLLVGEKRLAEALEVGQRAVALDPADERHQFFVIAVLASLGRYEEARAICQQAGDLGIDPGMAYVALGQSQQLRGDSEQALEAFHLAVEANPELAEAHLVLGVALRDRKEPVAALASLDEAIRLAPDLAQAHNARGLVLLQRGTREHVTEAILAFRKSLESDPKNAQTLSNLGISLAQMQEFDPALEALKQALALKPGFAMALANLGLVHERMDEPEEAISYYKKAVAADPDYALGRNNLIVSLQRLERFEEALEVSKGSTDPRIQFDLGVELFRNKKFPEAIEAFGRVLSLRPDFPDAIGNLTRAYLMADRGEEAIPLARKLIALIKKDLGAEAPDPITLDDLAVIYHSNGAREEALILLETLIQLSRKEHGGASLETLRPLRKLADYHLEAGNFAKAIGLMEEAVESCVKELGKNDPLTLGGMTDLAIYYHHGNRIDKAIALEEQTLELKRRFLPKDHPFLANATGLLADFYMEKGRTMEAIGLYREFLALRRDALGPADPQTIGALKELMKAISTPGRELESARILAEHLAHLGRAGEDPERDPSLTLRRELNELAATHSLTLVSPEAVDQYYLEHQDFFRATTVRLWMITIIRVEDPEQRAAQRKGLEALREKIEKGASFAEMASQHSVDPYKKDGGDRGTVKRGQNLFDEHLEKAIFAIKPGIPVIHESEKLLWILKVEDRREDEVAPLKEVREEIAEILRKPLREKLLTEWIEEGRKAAAGENQEPGEEIPEKK